jgi:dsDNA-binding SOS-regulon protein
MFKDKNLKLYETLAHEVAMNAAERRELTDEQREISKRLLAKMQERIAEMERALRAKAPRKVRAETAR